MTPPLRPAATPPPDPVELEAERRLIERAQAGDRTALGDLLRRYGPVVYRTVLLPRLGSAAAAEEALGATYQRVVERIGRFEWQGKGFFPWFRIVALRLALDQLRARRRESPFDPEALEREIDSAERDLGGGDSAVQAREDQEAARARIEAALGKLNARYKLAIRLRVLEERTREEVARELGVTVATFDVVLHRAMTALRKELGAIAPQADER